MDILYNYSKSILIETLELFKDVCEKLNIKFYLSHGTLLGAVKYKGFIPWEDDLDVMMSRKDFEVLKNYFLNNPTKEWSLGGAECGFYSLDFFGKFFNKKYYCLEEGRLLTHSWVDIYVLTEVRMGELDSYLKKLKFILALSTLPHKKVKYYDWYDSNLKIWFYYHWHQKQIGSLKFVDNLLYKHLTKYDEGDGYILLSPGIFSMAEKKTYKKEWFGEDKEVVFEGRKYLAPGGFDDVLKTTYGERYMTEEPPLKEQVFKHSDYCLKEGEHFVCTYKYLV